MSIKQLAKTIVKQSPLYPVVRRLLDTPFFVRRRRRGIALAYFEPRLKLVDRWLGESDEVENFTYDLTATNLKYLAAFAAHVSGQPLERALGYIDEIRSDKELAEHVASARGVALRSSSPSSLYGRRIGWYLVVRMSRPRVVVETGIDRGLGSCVLTAGLRRNSAEGHPGVYYGTDLNPNAGRLFTKPYSDFGKILYGDSLASLAGLNETIDLFINDSDHSAAYERREYELVAPRLSERAIVLGDNAHVTDELFEFARSTNRKFLFFKEEPHDHWYPGAGIGAAFPA